MPDQDTKDLLVGQHEGDVQGSQLVRVPFGDVKVGVVFQDRADFVHFLVLHGVAQRLEVDVHRHGREVSHSGKLQKVCAHSKDESLNSQLRRHRLDPCLSIVMDHYTEGLLG